MKRFCLTFLALCLIFSLAACGPNEEKPTVVVADPTAPSTSRDYHTEEATEVPTEETADPIRSMYVPGNSFVRVYRTENGSVWATVIMEYTNIGEMPLIFTNADIELQGRDGEVFQILEDVAFAPQTIAPGETGYYCETVELDTTEELVLTPKLPESFSGVSLIEEAAVPYTVPYATLSNSLYGGLALKATIVNSTETDGELVCVTAILKNDALEPVGFITGYLDGALAAGATAEVTFESFMLPGDLTVESIAEIETFAYPVLEMQPA